MAQLLTEPFTQLHVAFDPDPLLCEIERLGKQPWVEHPLGNLHSIPLVRIVDNKACWCSVIDALPKLRALLHTWKAPIGDSRVSILEPGAAVKKHVDVDYYWKHRLRVHLVLKTNPAALFGCGEEVLSLPTGQIWVSNNWAPHWIANNGDTNRIHIVIDTVGSPTLWKWIHEGWNSTSGIQIPKTVDLPKLSLTARAPQLTLERSSREPIRSPAQLQEIVEDCLNDMKNTANAHTIDRCRMQLRILMSTWHSIYLHHMDNSAAYPLYETALRNTLADLPNPIFWNGVDLHTTLNTQVGASLMTQPTGKDPSTKQAHRTQG